MAYTKTNWNDGAPPAISAANLNKIEAGIENNDTWNATQDGRISAVEGRATTLEGNVTSLEGRATSLEGRATALEGSVTSLEGRADAQDAKIATLETDVKDILPTDTASGAIASFPDGSDLFDYLSCICEINPVQDLHGYDKPWVGGAGKNKFIAQNVTRLSRGITGTLTDANYLTFSGTADDLGYAGIMILDSPITLGAGTYTFSLTEAPAKSVLFLNSSYAPVATISLNTSSATVTLTESKTILYVCTNVAQGDVVDIKGYVQIELGSSKTSFEPYSNICPITGWTGCEVSKAGVNLCYKVLPNPLSLVNVNYAKVITGDGTTAVFKAVKGQTYRVSGATGRNRSLIAYFDSDPVIDSVSNSVYQSPTQDYSDGYVFTAQQTAYCACYLSNSVLADANIQIELGSTATPYTPYNGTTKTITFVDEHGNQLTVYGGKDEIIGGVLTVNYASLTLNTADMNNSENYPGWTSCGVKDIIGSGQNRALNGTLSNVAPEVGKGADSNYFATNTVSPNDIIYLPKVRWNDRNQTDWIAEAVEMQLVIPLATPQTYQLTPTQMACLLGRNNVWADCGDIEEVKYKADVHLWVEKQLREINTAILALS